MAFAAVQHASGSGTGTNLTTSKNLPGAPTAGNWIIAAIDGPSSALQTTFTVDTSKWFLIDDVVMPSGTTPNTNCLVRVIGRLVQVGDTAAMPAFCTAGSGFNAWQAVEVSGGSGVWATDYHSSRNLVQNSAVAAIVSPADQSLVANTFALAFAAAYNETADGSWSAGWTVLENSHNAGNYGAWGCASRAFSAANSSVQVTFTRAGSSTQPRAIVTVLLTPSQPTVPHVVRHRQWFGANGGSIPGSIVMGGAPIAGNLLIAHLNYKDGGAAAPTVGASWTDYKDALNGSNPFMLGLRRYVSGDTQALAALCSAGSQVWSANVYEIGGGLSGTFSTDHASSKSGYQASGASFVTTSDNTTGLNQLAITSYGNYVAAAVCSETGATGLIFNVDSGLYGTSGGAWLIDPSSATAVQTTWTPGDSTKPQGYIQSIFGLSGVPGEGDAPIGTITVTAPQIIAGIVALADLSTVSMTAPEVSPVIEAQGDAAIGTVVLTAPGVTAEIVVSAALATIDASPPRARVHIHDPVVDARTTQLMRQTLAEGEGDARTTQLMRQTVAAVSANARTTQLMRQVIAEVIVQPRITQIVRQVIAEGVSCLTRWQQLWIIARKDGQVFRYTSLDEDFTWNDQLFKTCGSLMPSASQDVSAVGQVGNQELKGIFSDDGITEEALYGGLFNDALVEVWIVAYEGAESSRRIAAGWTGNLQHEEGTFTMEVVGPGSKLDQQSLVQTYGPGCRWVFGSPECGKDREALKISAHVTTPVNRGLFLAQSGLTSGSDNFGSSGAVSGDSGEIEVQWGDGLVRFLTGRNAGLECEVKTAIFESGGGDVVIELWDLAGFIPEHGDEIEILPGCDLSFPTCKDVYGNGINFGGFKDVPGEDSVMETPDAKLS